MAKKLITVAEAAREIGFCVPHIYRQLRARRWPGYRLSKKGWRVSLDEIIDFARRDVADKKRKPTGRRGAGNCHPSPLDTIGASAVPTFKNS